MAIIFSCPYIFAFLVPPNLSSRSFFCCLVLKNTIALFQTLSVKMSDASINCMRDMRYTVVLSEIFLRITFLHLLTNYENKNKKYFWTFEGLMDLNVVPIKSLRPYTHYILRYIRNDRTFTVRVIAFKYWVILHNIGFAKIQFS